MPADGQQGRPKRWPKSLSIFNRAMRKVRDIHGQPFQPDVALEPVRAVDVGAVREEFYVTYHAKGDTELQKQEARRKAFRRSLTTAQDDNLIGLRRPSEDGPEMVWFVVRPAPEDNE